MTPHNHSTNHLFLCIGINGRTCISHLSNCVVVIIVIINMCLLIYIVFCYSIMPTPMFLHFGHFNGFFSFKYPSRVISVLHFGHRNNLFSFFLIHIHNKNIQLKHKIYGNL